jgi:hypothetical protein
MVQHKNNNLPLPKYSSLRPVKDSLGLKASGVHKIPHKFGAVYIGYTGHMTEECITNHQNYLWLYHLEYPAMAEHSINKGHQKHFDNMIALAKLSHYTSKVIHEAIEINLHDEFKTEGDY